MAVIAYLLPGPGTCHPEMGKTLYNSIPTIRSAVDSVDRYYKEQKIDYKATRACFADSSEKLRYSSCAAPALLSLCWGTALALREKHVMPSMVGGCGYGDVLSLVISRAMDFNDGLNFLMARGEMLEQVWNKSPFHVLTVTGLPVAKMKGLLSNLKPAPIITGYHSADACTAAGGQGLLEKLAQVLKSHKELKVKVGEVLPGIDWPHPLFEAVSLKVKAHFESFKLERTGNIELFQSSSGQRLIDHATLSQQIANGCVQPILFNEMIAAMRKRGMDTAVELGPGTALASHTHAVDVGIRVLTTDSTKGLADTIKLAN